MPTYAYRCTECGHRFDLRQGFDASTQTDCTKCGKLAHRQMAAVPIIFKGSGWYTTDYAKKSGSYPSAPATDGAASSPSSPSSEREERHEQAREKLTAERGKPPTSTPTPSASSGSSGAKSAG